MLDLISKFFSWFSVFWIFETVNYFSVAVAKWAGTVTRRNSLYQFVFCLILIFGTFIFSLL